MKNKCIIPLDIWILHTLVPKLKNNVQSDILNLIECVLFLLVKDEKINPK